jgi:hypothetical protein
MLACAVHSLESFCIPIAARYQLLDRTSLSLYQIHIRLPSPVFSINYLDLGFCLMYKAASFGLLRSTPLRSSPSSLFKPLAPSRISASLVGSRSFGSVRPLGVLSGSLRYTCGSNRRSTWVSPRVWIGEKTAVLDRFERKFATMGK